MSFNSDTRGKPEHNKGNIHQANSQHDIKWRKILKQYH